MCQCRSGGFTYEKVLAPADAREVNGEYYCRRCDEFKVRFYGEEDGRGVSNQARCFRVNRMRDHEAGCSSGGDE